MHNLQAQARRKSQGELMRAAILAAMNKMVMEDGYTVTQLASWWMCSENQMRSILKGDVKGLDVGEFFLFLFRAAEEMGDGTRVHSLSYPSRLALVSAEAGQAYDGKTEAELRAIVVSAAQVALAGPIEDADAIEAAGRSLITSGHSLIGDAGVLRAQRSAYNSPSGQGGMA